MAKRKASPQIQWVDGIPGAPQKLKAPKPRDKLDAAIDWYEKYKPEMAHVMPGGVAMSKEDLDKFATKQDDDTWLYRGWTLKKAEVPAKSSELLRIAK